jgi:hypothetical protein
MATTQPADAGAELRIWLLGGFRVRVGSREVDPAAWRLREAKSLVKLLALTSGHRLHREQVMEGLPDNGLLLWLAQDTTGGG